MLNFTLSRAADKGVLPALLYGAQAHMGDYKAGELDVGRTGRVLVGWRIEITGTMCGS